VGYFGKTIDNDEDSIIPSLCPGKPGNEIHTDFIPFPFRNSQRLKGASRPLMLCFNTTTDIAISNVLSDFSLHPSPPKPLA
jgi:hypothetical protein